VPLLAGRVPFALLPEEIRRTRTAMGEVALHLIVMKAAGNSRVTIHMVASLDGFIAIKDGRVDWLE
jgi:hypothetical protein